MDLDDLIHTIDIVEYIGQYVELEQKGEEYWGLSPFKEEKTPSFSIRRENNSYYDFSSGLGGNIFSFTKAYFQCSSFEAVKKLEEYAGCNGISCNPREKLSATKLCKKFCLSRTNAKTEKSTILADDYMDRYEWKADKLKIWVDEGISEDTLQKFNVRYDSFANTIVYPIKNLDGKIVNIGARTLDPDWKSKGYRKYSYYQKWGTMSVIYGLYDNYESIIKSHEIILFEGCKSVLKAYTWGIKNCGALLTSHLSPNQMKILAKLGCRVVFALDKEVDIRKDRNINKLKQYVNIKYIYDSEGLIGEKDSPVDKGEEVFNALRNNFNRNL